MPTLTATELIAFNQELATLIRSGVPLEQGVAAIGVESTGRLQQVADEIHNRLQRGEPVADVLASTLQGTPEAYRALLAAGIRMGDLPRALELLAHSAQLEVEVRNSLVQAAIYPFLVCLFGYLLLFFYFEFTVPHWMEFWQDLTLDHPYQARPLVQWFSLAREYFWWLWWVPPAIAGALWGTLILGGRRALPGSLGRWGLRWAPWANALIYYWQQINFAKVLEGLLERQVPLVEALPLAGACSGNRRLAAQTLAVTETLRGGNVSFPERELSQLGPSLRWLLSRPHSESQLISSLRQIASFYRVRTVIFMDCIKIWLPPLLTAGVGGSVVLAYLLAVFVPLVEVWRIVSLDLIPY